MGKNKLRPALAAFLLMLTMSLLSTALSFFVSPVCADLGFGRGSDPPAEKRSFSDFPKENNRIFALRRRILLGKNPRAGQCPAPTGHETAETQKEMTLDLSANHSDCRGSFHEVVGFQHFRNLSFL